MQLHGRILARGSTVATAGRTWGWSGAVISVAFAIDCHDREVPPSWRRPRRSRVPIFAR